MEPNLLFNKLHKEENDWPYQNKSHTINNAKQFQHQTCIENK